MKKNNGFTLIELLAVITVLAIVLLIAVPAIGNVIEKSKKNTFESSAKGLLDAANYFHSKNILSLSEEPYIFSFDDGKSGEAIVDEKAYKLAYSGKAPDGGHVTLRDDGKIELYVCSNDYCACKSYDSPTISIVDTEVENCGLNEDGTVADNPIFSNELEDLKEDFAASQEELSTLRTDYNSTKEDLMDLKEAYENSQDDFLDKTYPVGSIYISKNNTNPETIFGGTWVAYGTGRTLVGVDTSQSEFNTVEKTGGEKTHTLSIAEMPSHTHIQNSHNHTQNSHTHVQDPHAHYQAEVNWWVVSSMADTGVGGSTTNNFPANTKLTSYSTATNQYTTATNNATTATNQNAGGGGAHNNLQPYITVYMWKRTN